MLPPDHFIDSIDINSTYTVRNFALNDLLKHLKGPSIPQQRHTYNQSNPQNQKSAIADTIAVIGIKVNPAM